MNDIPPALYTSEVLDIVKVGRNKWSKMRKEGIAPGPRYRGKGGDVYFGKDIAEFLGLTEVEEDRNYDPIMAGLEKLG